ncbi:hypothetical protein ACHAXT_009765 [Thalassiosira profunda]
MNHGQSSDHHHQHQHDGPSKLSAGLEVEDLQHFHWGEDTEVGGTGGIAVGAPAPGGAGGADDGLEPLPFAPGGNAGESIFGFARRNLDMAGLRAWSAGGFGGGASPKSVAAPLPAASKDDPLPGMVRSNSGSLSSDTETEAMSESDDDASDEGSMEDAPPAKGVTFNEQVRVLPIPPLAAYTHDQRYRMYANRFELRENKLRNKKEYEFDGFDWRNVTEEAQMAICPLSGELLHPAHL